MSKKRMVSGIDDFLKEEGIFEETQAQAVKEVIAWQLAEAMKNGKIPKSKMAALLGTQPDSDRPPARSKKTISPFQVCSEPRRWSAGGFQSSWCREAPACREEQIVSRGLYWIGDVIGRGQRKAWGSESNGKVGPLRGPLSRHNIVITMKAIHVRIRRIGNSHGAVIPKPVMEEQGLDGEAGAVLRRPASPARAGWAEAAGKVAKAGDDVLLMGEFGNAGDRELVW